MTDVTTPSPRVGDQRPGGRAARVRSAILSATEELLLEVGYEELTIEQVAARAGVHKTTVYRRWPTKSELFADAARTSSAENIPIPDSGSLGSDLMLLARSVAAGLDTELDARRARLLVAAAVTSGELERDMAGFWSERLDASAVIVERAIERGELPPDTDPNVIIETIIGPIWVRVLLTGEPITTHLADTVARLVTAGSLTAAPTNQT